MIIAFVDHDRRQQFSKEIKALATNKEKSKSIIEKEKLTASPPAMPLSTKKNKGKEHCKHCGLARHIKKSYYYLIPANQRLVDWDKFMKRGLNKPKINIL